MDMTALGWLCYPVGTFDTFRDVQLSRGMENQFLFIFLKYLQPCFLNKTKENVLNIFFCTYENIYHQCYSSPLTAET